MWWPLGDAARGAEPAVDVGRFRFRAVAEDIESLNRRAIEVGDLDITAISMHAYPHVQGRYALTSCGASMGEGYGPKIVARQDRLAGDLAGNVSWLTSPGVRIAIPGLRTTAYLALRLLTERVVEVVPMSFERIIDAVVSGEVEAGLVIHEAQLTYADSGLALVADLGEWWKRQTGLPLPLGGNAIRRDLDERFGAGASRELAGALKASIEYAMEQRGEGLEYALGFARGLEAARADEFVAMYVNRWTLDAGEEGREAIERLLEEGAAAGLCPAPGVIDLVRP